MPKRRRAKSVQFYGFSQLSSFMEPAEIEFIQES